MALNETRIRASDTSVVCQYVKSTKNRRSISGEGKRGRPSSRGSRGIPAIAGEVLEALSAQGQPLQPGQQHVDSGNLIVGGLREWHEQRNERRAQPHQFKVQAQQDGARPDRDRMVGEGKADLRLER